MLQNLKIHTLTEKVNYLVNILKINDMSFEINPFPKQKLLRFARLVNELDDLNAT